jgi:hypothetical protein
MDLQRGDSQRGHRRHMRTLSTHYGYSFALNQIFARLGQLGPWHFACVSRQCLARIWRSSIKCEHIARDSRRKFVFVDDRGRTGNFARICRLPHQTSCCQATRRPFGIRVVRWPAGYLFSFLEWRTSTGRRVSLVNARREDEQRKGSRGTNSGYFPNEDELAILMPGLRDWISFPTRSVARKRQSD